MKKLILLLSLISAAACFADNYKYPEDFSDYQRGDRSENTQYWVKCDNGASFNKDQKKCQCPAHYTLQKVSSEKYLAGSSEDEVTYYGAEHWVCVPQK